MNLEFAPTPHGRRRTLELASGFCGSSTFVSTVTRLRFSGSKFRLVSCFGIPTRPVLTFGLAAQSSVSYPALNLNRHRMIEQLASGLRGAVPVPGYQGTRVCVAGKCTFALLVEPGYY
eukprot:3934529-Rhodomonas_salina.1